MKTFLVTCLILLSSSSFAAASEKLPKHCQDQALGVMKALVNVSHGSMIADYVNIEITDYKSVKAGYEVTVQAVGLDGEDSDSAVEYALVYDLTPISKTCSTLLSAKLVGIN